MENINSPSGAGGKAEGKAGANVVNWVEKDNTLYRKFTFKNFSEAFAFMTRVAMEAEKQNHHPLWTNGWNTVEIWLNTHDAGDIVTEKDHQLASKINELL